MGQQCTDIYHVIPTNDLQEHICDIQCECHPSEIEGVVVHNSFDGREDYEEGRRLPN